MVRRGVLLLEALISLACLGLVLAALHLTLGELRLASDRLDRDQAALLYLEQRARAPLPRIPGGVEVLDLGHGTMTFQYEPLAVGPVTVWRCALRQGSRTWETFACPGR